MRKFTLYNVRTIQHCRHNDNHSRYPAFRIAVIYIYLLLYNVHSPGFYNNIHNFIMTYYILYLETFRLLVVFSFGRGRDRQGPPTYSYAYDYILTILCRHGSATSARLHCDPSRTCSAGFCSTRHAGWEYNINIR